jgi:hypothetical protein
MTTRTKRLLLAASLVLGVLVLGTAGATWLAYSILSPDSPLNHASAIETAREWGRLDPFPSSAQRLTVETLGSIFTREFRISFVAPPEDIETWLKSSPGTRDAVVTTPAPGVRRFAIRPGGGAEFAEVTVDDARQSVSIRVYWS